MTINPPGSPLKNVKLIIGLGNPGIEYENTYHNVGFIAIDYLAKKLQAEPISIPPRHHFTAFSARGGSSSGGKPDRFYLAKPTSFMNQSGGAVGEIIKFFKISPEQTLVIHDDSDIGLGLYKFSFGRGEAGHNGVSSIINRLKTRNFWRLRLGIRPTQKNQKSLNRLKAGLPVRSLSAEEGRPAEIKRMKAGDFVLNKIKSTHQKIFYSVLGDIIVKLTENEKP